MAKILVHWELTAPEEISATTDVMAQAVLHGDGLYLNVYERLFSTDNQLIGGVRIHWVDGQLVADIDTEENLHHEIEHTRLVLYDPACRPWHDN